jgi:hypothetical protein
MRHFSVKLAGYGSNTFISEVFQWKINEIEVHSFDEGTGMRSYAAFAGSFEPAALERLIRASFIKFCDCLDSSEGRESFFSHYCIILFIFCFQRY